MTLVCRHLQADHGLAAFLHMCTQKLNLDLVETGEGFHAKEADGN